MPRLLDASSLLNVLTERNKESVELLKGNSVLDLTFYEMGNALRGMCIKGKLDSGEATELMNIAARLVSWLSVVPVSELDLPKTLELAINESATFYDAAYVFAARKGGLGLVTDDRKLARVASKYVRIKTSSDL